MDPVHTMSEPRRNPLPVYALLLLALVMVAFYTFQKRGHLSELEKKQGTYSRLDAAIRKGDLQAIHRLLTTEAEAEAKKREANWMFLAVYYGHPEVVQLLLDRGWSPNGPRGSDYLVGYAANWGYTEILKRLLKHGAKVEPEFPRALTALMIASRAGYTDIVQALLEAGANVNAEYDPSRMLRSPMYILPKPEKAVRTPRSSYGPRNATTPLMMAAGYGYADVVELLLKHGAKVNYRGKSGVTALSLAKEYHHPEIVAMLRKAGAKE